MQHEIEGYLSYLGSEEKNASPNTITAYRNDLSQMYDYLRAFLSAITDSEDSFPWSGVATVRLMSFVGWLNEKSYKPATLSRKVAVVKSYFHWLAARGIIKADPTVELDSPKVEQAKPEALSLEEVEILLQVPDLETAAGLRDSAIFKLIYAAGLKASETVNLEVGDLDLETDYVQVTNKGAQRRIPFDDKTRDALKSYLETARPVLIRHSETGALFVNDKEGERLTRQGVWHILKQNIKRVNARGDVQLSGRITTQTLRHSFAIHLLADGANPRDVQTLLGHASPRQTTNLYAA